MTPALISAARRRGLPINVFLVVLLLLGTRLGVLAQGTVFFDNLNIQPYVVTNDLQGHTGWAARGQFSMALFWATNNSGTPVAIDPTKATPLIVGVANVPTGDGLFDLGSVTTPTQTPTNGTAEFMVVGWTGTYSNYNAALAAGALVGQTAPFFNSTGGGGAPPTIPSELTNWVNDLVLVPKPFTSLPTITAQPLTQTNYVGNTLTLSLGAISTNLLSFQWSYDGTPLAGATKAQLVLTNLQLTNTGTYSVVVTNIYGAVPSSNAVLTVLIPIVPTANSQTVALLENSPEPVFLSGSDPASLPLVYTVLSAPTHGTLVGTPPMLTYVPATNYTGSDSLTFKVNNGQTDSTTATVSLNALPSAVPFEDDFQGPTFITNWLASLPNGTIGVYSSNTVTYAGAPSYVFNVLNGSAVIRLHETNNPLTRVGWSSAPAFNPGPGGFHYEVRFNTINQSASNSIDGFVEIWLLDAASASRYDLVSLFGNANSTDRRFFAGSSIDQVFNSPSFNYTNTTWYRLLLEGSGTQNIRATLLTDGDVPLISRTFSHNTTAFPSGFQIAISQAVGPEAQASPSDVDVDFAKVTLVGGLPPTITCPADLTVSVPALATAATNVSLGQPTVSGNCSPLAVTNNATAVMPVGVNLVTWKVTDACGSSSTCQQRVIVTNRLPTATIQPSVRAVQIGANVTFAVTVAGVGPFTYQWRFDGTNIGSAAAPESAVIRTIAGNGIFGYSGDGGPATSASLEATSLGADAAGDLFIADGSSRIRMVAPNGSITTVAGNGISASTGDGGAATNASLTSPQSVAADGAGNLFIVDGNRVRKVGANGIISTIAGNNAAGYSGDGGPATNATLRFPEGIAVDANGNVFIADYGNKRLRRIGTNGIITTIAGNGSGGAGGDGGAATNASLAAYGLTVDASGNLFAVDPGVYRVREVSTNGIITTIAGNGTNGFSGDGAAATNANINSATSIAADPFGNLFLPDVTSRRVRKVDASGLITTVAGNGLTGSSGDGGAATNASFTNPQSVTTDTLGDLFVSDTNIREVTFSTPTLLLRNVNGNNTGVYDVIVTGSFGSITSSVAVLTVATPPVIVSQPQSLTNATGTTATFKVNAIGSVPLSFQWNKNGSPLFGATNASLMLSNVTSADVASYAVKITNSLGSTTSAVATLTVMDPPVITIPPMSLTVSPGATASFNVAATGSNLQYQWSRNGNPIGGATSTTLTLTNVSAADNASYTVAVSNFVGATNSPAATLTLATLPIIVNQPASVVVKAGTSASFSVGVAGIQPLAYQWSHNGAKLAGATKSNYSIATVTSASAGSYSVSVTNSLGSAVSTNALLTVILPPTITRQPINATVVVGRSNTFYVIATGTAPLSYQWRLDGTNLPGATATNYTVKELVGSAYGITTNDAGTYSVVITNSAGSITSSGAVLTVNPDTNAPLITVVTPYANQIVTNNVMLCAGITVDNSQVTNVSYSFNSGSWQSATTTNGWKNWSVSLNGQLVPGANTFIARATDFSGNVSANQKSIKFTYNEYVPLTLLINGSGRATPNTNGQYLIVGKSYAVTALASNGWVFTNWMVGASSYPGAALTFTMQPGLVLQANFVPTPFTANIIGHFNGLFYAPRALTFQSSGLTSFTLNSNGVFSGSIVIEGQVFPLTGGLFSPNGVGHATVSRSSQHQSTLSVDVTYDLSGASQAIFGTVSSLDGAWSVPLIADQTPFSPTNSTPNAGLYTFEFPGFDDPSLGPQGNSYGTVTVSPSGTVTPSGKLGDGTVEVEALPGIAISASGLWPVYMSLYKGGGELMGWVGMTRVPGIGTNISGSVTWIKEANATNAYFPNGFTNTSTLVGSGYVAPPAGTKLLNLTNGIFFIDGGDLAAAISSRVTLTTANQVVIGGDNPQKIKVTLVPSTGFMTGSFVDPVSGTTNVFNGVIVPQANYGAGQFLTPTNSGAVYLGN